MGAEGDVFVLGAAIFEEFERGPVMRDLPGDLGGDDEQHEGDAGEGPWGAEQATLRGDQEGEEQGGEEEGHGVLVEEAEAGGGPEEEPESGRAAVFAAAVYEDQGKEGGHPEHSFAGVHREEAVGTEVLGDDADGDEGERLGGAAAA